MPAPTFLPTLRRASALAALLALAFAGCDCGGSKTRGNSCEEDSDCKAPLRCVNGVCAGCQTDADCSDDGSKYCDTHNPPVPEADESGCVPAVRQCTNEGQCCPGQICSNQASICFDKFVQCADDATCAQAVRGQVCRPLGESQDKGCTFEKCGDVDPTTGKPSCPDGTDCFNGYCVGEPPCNGGCAPGSVCTPVNNRCFVADDPTTPYPGSCQQECRPGTILVFRDGYNVFNRCDRRLRECECQPLPPVRANDLARHSAAAVAGDRVFVSAYDGDHGDLVVHEFDKATQKLRKTEWIDGIPTAGAVIGDPDGPRGGRSAPGPDVGLHTSIAYDAASDTIHVAYYAAKDGNTVLGDLKYVARSGSVWGKPHVVDGRSEAGADAGDAGLYTSLALSPDGFPVVSYFVRSGQGSEAFKTAVRVARATTKTPAKASDWKVTELAGGTRTPPPCSAAPCTADQVCTEGGSNGACRQKAPSANDCKNPSCGSDEACVLVGGAPVCRTSLRAGTLASIPEGNGLFTSIAYLDDKPVVVWYDRKNGTLKGAIATSDSASRGAEFPSSSIKTLDDGAVPGSALSHDVGQFASVATAPATVVNRIAVAYFDATSRQLRVLTAKAGFADPTPLGARVVDDGAGTPDTDPVLFVGADTSVRFDAQGHVVVAYQDSTRNDLRLAVQGSDGKFKVAPLSRDGAGGFYANLLVDGAERYATHAIIRARSPSESANRLELLKVTTP